MLESMMQNFKEYIPTVDEEVDRPINTLIKTLETAKLFRQLSEVSY